MTIVRKPSNEKCLVLVLSPPKSSLLHTIKISMMKEGSTIFLLKLQNNREHIFQRNIAFKKVQYFVI